VARRFIGATDQAVTPSDRLASALADRYRIERELGAGGMATVYLAEDLKHDRKVAIKVLKPELAAVLGAERFVVEIKTTASLQHPHILPLFDSGTANGFLFYVMPYIQGETIREKLNRETQFGVDEAVRIAREVASALDYAHRKGMIHRDIKPENILLHDGSPMVMDFGIALAVSAAAGGRMTETGLSLGTPHYMSPEQATAEKEITARSDVYSLASVLYEALSGEPPHSGGSAQQVIMKILTEQPQPVTALRKSVPPNVAAALTRALEKLPADRFESAKAFAEALHDPHFTVASTGATAGAHTVSRRSWNRTTVAMGTLAAVMAVVAGWAIASRPDVRPAQVTRTTIELPEQVQLASPTFAPRIAISRDGSRIVFEGWRGGPGNGRRLFIRLRDRLQVDSIPGTEGASAPFFSPDGKRIGFFTINPPAMKWVSVDGGPVAVVADAEFEGGFGSTPSSGAVWGIDDAIYHRSLDGVKRLPLGGGPGTLVSFNDSTADEKGHTPTDVLPNGRGLIIAVPHTPNTMCPALRSRRWTSSQGSIGC
jgi:eukaryotic-like serine/threonine-protein kinase